MKKIHYAKLNSDGDIPCFEFNRIEEIRNFVAAILAQNPTDKAEKLVYLIAIQDEIFVSQNCELIQELFDGNLNVAYPFFENEDIFIQEYPSYEDAYMVALYMRETNPLCYKQ